MVEVSFVNEMITVTVAIQDETLFEFARDLANDGGLSLLEFKDLTIEGGRY